MRGLDGWCYQRVGKNLILLKEKIRVCLCSSLTQLCTKGVLQEFCPRTPGNILGRDGIISALTPGVLGWMNKALGFKHPKEFSLRLFPSWLSCKLQNPRSSPAQCWMQNSLEKSLLSVSNAPLNPISITASISLNTPNRGLLFVQTPKMNFWMLPCWLCSLSLPLQHGIRHQQAEAGGERGGDVRAEVELHQLQPHPHDCDMSGRLRGTSNCNSQQESAPCSPWGCGFVLWELTLISSL